MTGVTESFLDRFVCFVGRIVGNTKTLKGLVVVVSMIMYAPRSMNILFFLILVG